MRPRDRVRVFVAWATVLSTDTLPPSAQVTKLLFDARVEQFWDVKRGVQAEVAAAAARGTKKLEDFKPGEHTPYDLVLVYRPGTRWGNQLPAPEYCGVPVATSIEDLEHVLTRVEGGATP